MSQKGILQDVASLNPVREQDLEGPPEGAAAHLRDAAGGRGGGLRRRRPLNLLISTGATAVGIAAVAVVLIGALPRGGDTAGDARPETTTVAIPGVPAPGVDLPLLDRGALSGNRLRLDQLRGRWVVLAFAASWCDPCRGTHLREIRDFARQTRGDVLTVVVASSDLPRYARPALSSRHGDYPLALDRRGRALNALGGTGLPATFVIDPEGRVVDVVNGRGLRSIPQQLARWRSGASTAVAPTAQNAPPSSPGATVATDSRATIDIPTPIGTAHLPTRPGWTASDYTLIAAANGVAVVSTTKDESAANGGICIFVVPLAPDFAAGGGCSKRTSLAQTGSVIGITSGNRMTAHVAILPADASGTTTANGRPALVQNGVAIVTAPSGANVVFRNGSWSLTSLDPTA